MEILLMGAFDQPRRVSVYEYRDKLRTLKKLNKEPRYLNFTNIVFDSDLTLTDVLDEFPMTDEISFSADIPGKFLHGLKSYINIETINVTLSPIYGSKNKFKIPKYVSSINISPISMVSGEVLGRFFKDILSKRHRKKITVTIELPDLVVEWDKTIIPPEIETLIVLQRRNHPKDFIRCMRTNGFGRKTRTELSVEYQRGLSPPSSPEPQEHPEVTMEGILNKILENFVVGQ
jgi:hypothetical protein